MYYEILGSFISGETRVFRVSVQRIGAHLAPMLSHWLSCIDGSFAPCVSFAENTSKLSPPKSADRTDDRASATVRDRAENKVRAP
jgi:hypothetical protein